MSQQTLNVGTADNDGTGDTLRVAGQKINANFTETYSAVPAHEASLDPHPQYAQLTWLTGAEILSYSFVGTTEAQGTTGETVSFPELIGAKGVLIQVYTPNTLTFGTGVAGDSALLWVALNGSSGEYSYMEQKVVRVSPTLVVPDDIRVFPPVLAPIFNSTTGQIKITYGGGTSWTSMSNPLSIEILAILY